jgi:hypothetical protein
MLIARRRALRYRSARYVVQFDQARGALPSRWARLSAAVEL